MGCQYLGLPDGYPVLGRQIHAIAFGDAVEIQELIKLLQGAVDAQVLQGMRIFQVIIDILERYLDEPAISIGAIELVIVKVLFRCEVEKIKLFENGYVLPNRCIIWPRPRSRLPTGIMMLYWKTITMTRLVSLHGHLWDW